ncbi:hypothetical protein [Streptomyces sp. NBC_01012]|uniref:hypothetical protein n=1 Tax=Streptomyces sp. NBC_01012 TaxID=2903717 RepID=UPI00386849FD|nr:hypothetical protein OG623_13085 [Streptomyces sp. NBC_01012]
MADNDTTDPSSTDGGAVKETAAGPPYAGIATTSEVVAAVKNVSSQIHDFAGVPGKASEPGPGVSDCQGRDPERYYQVYHPWNFSPRVGTDNEIAMANFKKRLTGGGWVLKDSYIDNSPNKNLNLVADNDSKKVSVWIVEYSRNTVPSIGINVRSACYQVPEGQTVDHY